MDKLTKCRKGSDHMDKLTKKQALFVEEYLVDFNATRAAIRAGYSQKTAGAIGQENLTKPEIQKKIQESMQKRQERTQITQDFVIKELFAIASADASDIPRSPLKTSSKIKALELLGRHLGIFLDPAPSVSVTQAVTVSDLSALSDSQLRDMLSRLEPSP